MHIPVLKKEVLKYLNPKPNENFIDCTIGQGGQSKAILEKIKPEGKVLGIELDPEFYRKIQKESLKRNFKQRLVLVNDSYTNLKEIIEKKKFGPINGILFDLGMSSWHLEKSGRGFSFRRDEPLIMRYDWDPVKRGLTAQEIINKWPEKEIAKILKEYGQERFAKRIARRIVKEREIRAIKTTSQLVGIIKRALPAKCCQRRLHFAARTFQALRIAVNDELNNLKKALPQAVEALDPKGRLVVISFHSLEDRIVKNFLRDKFKKGLIKILTKKPIRPREEEIRDNYRSRSAKLRAGIKI